LKIIYERSFSIPLLNILQYISKDKKSASIKFKNELKGRIELLIESPLMCKKSFYFEDENYRDLVFKGYTIIYKIENEDIKILDIFKWEKR
jgi:plasmid stabilization system protein ParE